MEKVIQGWRYWRRHGPYRLRYPKFQDTTLFMTLALWLCTLPVLAMFIPPFLGWEVTAYLAGFLLVADLVACLVLCAFRLPEGRKADNGKED